MALPLVFDYKVEIGKYRKMMCRRVGEGSSKCPTKNVQTESCKIQFRIKFENNCVWTKLRKNSLYKILKNSMLIVFDKILKMFYKFYLLNHFFFFHKKLKWKDQIVEKMLMTTPISEICTTENHILFCAKKHWFYSI